MNKTNREIKFRAWDKKRKKMYKVLHLHSETYNNGQITWATVESFDVIEQKEIHLQVQPENCILMQSTGLTDKNGVEIYEGDVVKSYTNLVYQVQFNEGAFKIINENFFIEFSKTDKTIVIGNIYEHSELLNHVSTK